MGRPSKYEGYHQLAEELGVSLTRAVQIERETLHRIRWLFGEESTPKPVDNRPPRGKNKPGGRRKGKANDGRG